MTGAMTEDRLVQQTTAEYFETELGWDSVYAYHAEDFGPDSLLGRNDDTEVVLVRYLRAALKRYNPDLPDVTYASAVTTITAASVSKSPLQVNREKYALFKSGVPVKFKNDKGIIEERHLKVFDFGDPLNNDFRVVRELWIKKVPYRRRPDIIGFVNGIPLLFIELKNVHKDIRRAYNENLKDYKDTIPHLFDHNAFIILSNGDKAKMGSLSAKYGHFKEWKRLDEEAPGVVDFETMLKGVCTKSNFMDLFENFILFDQGTGTLAKIVARNHQYLGVNRAIRSVTDRDTLGGQLGVFWHTQGSGKSYSMVFFSQKVDRKLTGNFTFLIVTDREDLDTQLYKTFAGCGIVDNDKDPCRASSGAHLRKLFSSTKAYIFTMIHKFNQDVMGPEDIYSDRSDIIVISDEAHRTQYGRLALNMRNALPNAHYIGFTGTPLFKDDEITKKIFGGYVSTYDFQRAVEDDATVPLFYDSRGEKLKLATTDINMKLAEKLEAIELDADQEALLERDLSRAYHVITAAGRLTAIARDFVTHYATAWETGKAMFVSIDKITAVRMYKLVQFFWQEHIKKTEADLEAACDEQETMDLRRKIEWLKETRMAVVVSEEQGEIEKFERWDLDIVPHRTLMKNGFETPDGKTLEIDAAFKREDHPFRVVFVCAMWLTGFDVPSLSTLYLDKPLKAHTLMQAIARANRINEGKNNGLIVDYCGILKNLREALATFATGGGAGTGGCPESPVKPDEELLEELAEAIDHTRAFLKDRGFALETVTVETGFDKISAIKDAKDVINQSEETRKRFEIQARMVFKKFKACLNIKAVNDFKAPHDAINIIYKKLQGDRDTADISRIIQELHEVVDQAVEAREGNAGVDDYLYDMSKIDFGLLQEEFARKKHKNTTVYCLKEAIEKKLAGMLKRNPLRTDFNRRYQEIIKAYNEEKNRTTIEKTFEELMTYYRQLSEEEKRAAIEGLTEEQLAVFDLLLKPEISRADREKVKQIAGELLEGLKAEKLNVENWREKEVTKAAVKTFIHNYLYDENTGLPDPFYSIDDVEQKTGVVFDHVFMQYQDSAHSVYAAS